MSKKGSVNTQKKSKRRLKRSVRRSIAAVLMITAIGVAAIPVPENYAVGDTPLVTLDDETTVGGDVHDFYTYPTNREKDEDGNIKDLPIEETYPKSYSSDTFGLDWHLKSNGKSDLVITDEDGELDMTKLRKHLYGYTDPDGKKSDGTIFQSQSINNLGNGQWDLGWQFMFYEVTNPTSGERQGVICKYNSQYRAEEVNLDLTPNTGYYVVEPSQYEGYYSKDNTNFMKGMDRSPWTAYEYLYTDWSGSETDAAAKAREFFEEYFPQDFKAKLDDFAAYKAAYDAYMAAGGEGGTGTPPDKDLMAPLKIVPADRLSEEQKLKFYCDHDITIQKAGTGYTLVSLIDSRITGGGAAGGGSSDGNSNYIYVAHGGKLNNEENFTTQYSNDANGFLVTGHGVKMCAIGERAFAKVSNVDVLTIPKQIGYIGHNAFHTSFIKAIDIESVDFIGNRAFQNCTELSTVKILSSNTIGTECFENSAVSNLALPYSVSTIGWGAFANCNKLTNLNLNSITQNCEVKEAAFYNCTALTTISMADSAIKILGDAVFAVDSGASPINMTLPQTISTKDGLGDHLFAGRSSLEYVVFPKDYGRTAATAVTIPDNMFHACVNLQYVEFPVDIRNDPYACGYVSYSSAVLFRDVINNDFYVRGPEKNSAGVDAAPRKSTYSAKARTAVNNFIPYVFKNSAGVDCYEVAMGGYRYEANENGELTSCVIAGDEDDVDGNIVIPSQVGNYPIDSIKDGCFDDETLRKTIKSITIEDNSITSIDNDVFSGLLNLKKVIIGNSVISIGDRAFADCKNLIDVTFHSPANGYEGFTIGNDAFKTGGEELTFHGDIVDGYAPFDWAMEPNNMILDEGVRVCYISLTPTYLTVMYDANTGLVTLIDYPKYDQVDAILEETHELDVENYFGESGHTYKEWMETRSYAIYRDSAYDRYRKSFGEAWANAATEEEAEALYYQTDLFGPWITPEFVLTYDPDDYRSTTTPESPDPEEPEAEDSDNTASAVGYGNGNGVIAKIADFFFEPLVVEAYGKTGLKAYYQKFPYSAQDNADSDSIFSTLTEEERGLINATKNIVIPEGVDSIDVNGYINGSYANRLNARTYLIGRISDDAYRMYTNSSSVDADDNTDVVPGLFSGAYKDYKSESENEEYTRGNDRVETVTLNSVKFLPDHAFDSCERLMAVVIGEKCDDIGVVPFRGCTNLTNVNFSNNPKYVAENGIIYSRNRVSGGVGGDTGDEDNTGSVDGGFNGTYTIEECLYARGRVGGVGATTVPDVNYNDGGETLYINNVSAIKKGAFEGCINVNNVYLNGAEKLAELPVDCFRDCTNLSKVSFPKSLNYVEEGVFWYDNNLKEIEIPGREVFISARAFLPADETGKTGYTDIKTYSDSSARRYADKYREVYRLQYAERPEDWSVVFLDADGNQVGETLYVKDGDPVQTNKIPVLPEREDWVFQKWISTNGSDITSPITSDTVFIAKGYSVNGMIDGVHYTVDFLDQLDGTQIGTTQLVLPGEAAIAPQAPVHDGYTFVQWSSDEYLNVQRNLTILAMYSGSGTGNGTGGNGTGGNGTGDGTGGNGNGNGNGSGTNTPAPLNPISATSSSTSAGKYTVTVINGSGSGSYEVGTTVVIAANTPASGKVFSKWTTDSDSVKFASVSMTATTFVMPASNVTVTANFIDGSASNTVSGTVNNRPTGSTATGTTGNGNTRVDITKPGISNKDLATATVNGSTDNFVVKISETNEATQAVINALTNKYGNLDSILYYAMDISLYDSTGTVKITDTTGLSVDITIPIPDALTVFGGNNMAGAVVGNNQLEDLSERFSTINGIPCISFTATHFSPYTVYVDTQNLSEGMLDITPKTGDPIHPKWFLSLGLACLSIILFMKKDKKPVVVKAA